ncbi:MAG TPA: M3 family metallopeptidase [Candidatus Saccharimonadales bacterium]|nr:M3 family metallopeptidase [Candidatus Saccharimonadales bacterium]
MANSFSHPLGEINFDKYKISDVKEVLDNYIELAKNNDQKIIDLKPTEVTYKNTVIAFCDATDEIDFLSGVVGHLASTLGGDWQQQDQIVSEQITKLYSDRGLNKKLYNQLSIAQKLAKTDPEKRLIDEIIRGYKRGGIDLPKDKKDRLKQIRTQISKLTTDFGQNAVKANDEAFLLVKSENELAGTDESDRQIWAEAAKNVGRTGFYIQFSAPNFDKIMTHCSVQKTRQAMHKISRMRAPQNEAIAKKILALRQELAEVLGYKNYIEYVLSERMAKNQKTATDFIKMLGDKYLPTMQKEAEQLGNFIKQNGGEELDITDVDGGSNFYYASKMYAKNIGLDIAELQEYFVMDNVLHGMFDCLQQLYGVRFKKNINVAKAQKDVEVYDIYNEGNEHIGRIWGDWYARQGKQAGAWQHTMYFADRDMGIKKPHLSAVCTNFTPPSKGKPSLLSLRDVETLWHEFGHAMHCSFSNTKLKAQNAYGTKWDFVEAPSQIMENWVWQKEVLDKIAKHYKTGKSLPKTVGQKLLQSRAFRVASIAAWTIGWSAIDLELHGSYNQSQSLSKFYRQTKQKYCPVTVPDYDNNICTFTHIFAGGYAAGYYGYKWAEVIEADLFSKFLAEGILNPKVGHEYRDKILARGDEVSPEVLIKDFLGRATTTDAILKRDGIK